jgi:ADP-ribose pyrophosphatase YjhB (NUDIX family)
MPNKFIDEIQRLKTIADLGLLYCSNEYDKERYMELQEMSYRLLSFLSGEEIETLKDSFLIVKEYPTAKVDIRGLLLSADKKVLLVRESSDNKWSLPGGWADVGHSPKEVIRKEFKEETGIDIIPNRLVAVFDKKMHPHPTQLAYVYKMVFYCEATSHQIKNGFDVLDVQYFNIDKLPLLSEDRILKSQIELVYKKVLLSDLEAYVD